MNARARLVIVQKPGATREESTNQKLIIFRWLFPVYRRQVDVAYVCPDDELPQADVPTVFFVVPGVNTTEANRKAMRSLGDLVPNSGQIAAERLRSKLLVR